MGRGPKKHIKKIRTPKSWMLGKLGGLYATRPSCGPHKLKESIPLSYIIKNKLNYALNRTEVIKVLNDKEGSIKIDHKTRRDLKYPVGIQDVLSIEKTGENFRVLLDTKGRFVLRSIKPDEA